MQKEGLLAGYTIFHNFFSQALQTEWYSTPKVKTHCSTRTAARNQDCLAAFLLNLSPFFL